MGIGAAAVLAAGILAVGCSDDSGGDIIVVGGGNGTVPTGANAFSSDVDQSWATGEKSINHSGTNELGGARYLPNRDGSGIMVWSQGDDADARLYLAHVAADGAVEEPHVVQADVAANGYGSDTVESVVTVMAPNGGIAIAFLATQDDDLTSTTDVASTRVYVGKWTSADGFSDFTAVDTNTQTTDDNDVDTLFTITNLRDGSQRYDESDTPDNDLEENPSGSAGDSAQNLQPAAMIAWLHINSNGDRRIEGYSVELDTLATPLAADIQDIDLPGVAAGEDVGTTVITSGLDAIFFATDTTGDEEMYFVRLDPVAGDIEDIVQLSRGASASSISIDTFHGLVGDGYRPLNGQTSSWVFVTESGFDSGTSDLDGDLVIYQIADDFTFEVDEFDHNPVAGVTGGVDNPPANVQLQAIRGMPGAFIFYTSTTDVATGSTTLNTSAYARAIRFNDDEALADNVSNEEQLNTTTGPDADTNVTGVNFFDLDPFCDPDTFNGGTYVAITQGVENDDTARLYGVNVQVDDPSASPIVITAGTEDQIATTDTGWSTSLNGDWNVVVLESNDPDGDGVVFYVDQGNNKGDDGVSATDFNEPRLFAFAPTLVTGQTTDTLAPVQIDSDSDSANLPFDHWQTLTSTGNSEIYGVNTPRREAARDFASWGADQAGNITIAEDELAPQYAYAFAPEFLGTPTADNGQTWIGRVFDLSGNNFAAPEDRFTPALTDLPARVGNDDGEFDDLNENLFEVLTQDNNVLVIFNNEQGLDSGTNGKVYGNVITPTGVATEPALMSNDIELEIVDSNYGINSQDLVVVPGPTCDTAEDAMFFYIRETAVPTYSDNHVLLQGRKMTGATAPR